MEKTIRRHAKIACAVVVGMLINHGQLGQAGWSGAMNGTGYGWASVNVTSSFGVFGTANTPNMTGPSASMDPTTGYAANAFLPYGSSSFTVARIKGSPGYVWKANTADSNGDSTDNPELESRVNIVPADCALLTIESSLSSSNGHSGTITVDAVGTGGTAIWLRGFEFHGQGAPGGIDDLKTNGAVKWDILLVGPFDLTRSNCNAIIIPFTVETDFTNLFFLADGVAKSSNPLTISCPSNVVFECTGSPLAYPPLQTSGGCGNVAVTYSPPANLLPNGVPTLVTATATDSVGNTNSCTFTATRQGLAFNGFYPPINGTDGTCPAPLRTINKGSIIPVKFDVTCNGLPYGLGTPTLTIQQYSSPQQGCNPVGIPFTGDFQYSASVWHINWDTSGVNFPKNTVYKLIATLQDGTTREVFVKLK